MLFDYRKFIDGSDYIIIAITASAVASALTLCTILDGFYLGYLCLPRIWHLKHHFRLDSLPNMLPSETDAQFVACFLLFMFLCLCVCVTWLLLLRLHSHHNRFILACKAAEKNDSRHDKFITRPLGATYLAIVRNS